MKETPLVGLLRDKDGGKPKIWLEGVCSEHGWKEDPKKLLDALNRFLFGLEAGQFIAENEAENEIEDHPVLVSLVRRANGEIELCTSGCGREEDPKELLDALTPVVITLRQEVERREQAVER